MQKQIINIPEGIYYLGEYPKLTQLLPNSSFVFNKYMTGCGATTLFLEDNVPTVLCSPRKELIHCKATSPRHYGKVHAFGYSINAVGNNGDIVLAKITAMKEYVQSHMPFAYSLAPKILVTYDSCKHVMQGLLELGVLDKFRFIVDEFQTLWTDAAYRGDVEAEFTENLQYASQVVYLSATPYIEKYLDQLDDFKNLPFVELNWPMSSLHYSSITRKRYINSSPHKTIAQIISDYRRDGYFNNNILDPNNNPIPATQAVFFVNEVKFILETIKRNKLKTEEVLIICGDNDDNAQKLRAQGFTIGHAPQAGDYHPAFTFTTKCAYEGTDFNHPLGYAFIFSDISKEHLAIDISLNLKQILGRLRISPYRYSATFYCKTLPDFSEEEQRAFEAKIQEKSEVTNVCVQDFEKITSSAFRATAARKFRYSQKGERYKNDYISVVDDKITNEPKLVFNRYAFINELRSFEVQKSQYENGALVLGSINDALGHSGYKELEEFKSNFTGTFENRMKIFCEFADSHPQFIFDINTDASIPKEFKYYYSRLGTNTIRTLHWNESFIQATIANANASSCIDTAIYGAFEVGCRYERTAIKDTLQRIFNDYQPGRSATATDLGQWFELKEIKLTVKGTRQRGYEIISVK